MSSDTTNEDPKARSNFIRHIIDDDLAAGKYQQIHTRFPPEPNGYLHIGHAKSICLNFGLAYDYEGQCNLRFDDTNPEKESQAYIDSIADDVRWLGFAWEGDKRFTSNYFEQLHSYAIELIEKGLAYVDFLSPEEASQYRGTLTEPGKNSPYRDTSADTNLEHFAKMRAGDYAEGECVLRAKIDMSSSFMCMRDPILYRVRFFDHHQTGGAWNIYPMYDFAHCISDALEGVTHSLCTLEFQDNRRLYDWILEHISLENSQARPHQYEFSRLNLEYTVMSKRKLLQLVDGNHVSGWDDPRMPTISGLRRRGYTPESVVEFCARIGVTKQENQVEMSMLEACIREELNAEAPRAMAVLRPLKLVINNYPEETSEILTAPLHPQNDDMGTRQLSFSRTLYIDQDDFRMEANKKYKRLKMGKEVRLRNAYVVRADEVDTDDEGNITCVYCTYDPETLGKNPADGRKVAGVIHWVDAATAVPATINNYDRLFNVPNPGQEDDMLASLNPESLITYHGFVEQNLEHAPLTQNWQFEREGYYCVDSGDSTADALVFNQTVALRDTWVSG